MAERDEVDDADDETVALAFGPDVKGWPTSQHALDAFLEHQVVAAGGPQNPGRAPEGEPIVEYETDEEATWTLSSGGVPQGWVSAMRGPTGWVIQAYSRPRR